MASWRVVRVAGKLIAFLACGVFFAATAAHAGAYLMQQGQGQVIVETRFSDSARGFDAYGRLVDVAPYRKLEVGPYIEYGLTDWLTLVGRPSWDNIRSGTNPTMSYNGVGGSEVGAKLGLLQGGPFVAAVQASLRVPLPAPSFVTNGALVGNTDVAGDFRLLLGYGFDLRGLPAFVEAQAGYRVRGGGWPNEWRLDLTVGMRPWPQVLLLLQSFSEISDGVGARWPRNASHKIEPSLVYDLTPAWSVQAGFFLTVAGVNAGREFGPKAAVWYRF